MKKLLLLLSFVFALWLAQATPTLMIGSLATIYSAAPTNSSSTAALQYNPALQQFAVSHGALTSTNEFYLAIQSSADNVNFTTNGYWFPSNTNAATEIVSANTFFVTNYVRVTCTTTGTITVGGTYGQ